MNPRTTLVLALVAAALGAFIWIYEIGGEAERKAASDDALRVHSGIDAEEIEAVELETTDGVAARFERQEGAWRIVSPVQGRADAVALDAIASALADLRREGRVAEPGELAEYGLGEDARVVRFEIDGETRGLRIGRTSPVGGHRYVARLADDAVAYVSSFRLNAMNRKLADLRDRRILHFAVGDVESVELAWPGGAVSLERESPESWRMTAPTPARADDITVRDLLSDLSFLRAKSFLDPEIDPDLEAGIGPERAARVEEAAEERSLEVRLTLGAAGDGGGRGESGARTLGAWIGGEVEGGRLLEGPSGRRYVVTTERLEDVPRRVGAYRYKTLSEFEVADAQRLELRFAEGDGMADAGGPAGPAGEASGSASTIVLDRAEGAWRSEDVPVDPDAVSDFVRDLAQLRADDVLAEAMGEAELASLGLAPPRARVRVSAASEAEDGGPLAEVRFGRIDPERGLFAQKGGSPIVYRIDAERSEDWPVSRVRFESRIVVSESEAEASGEQEVDPESLGEDPMEGIDVP